MKSNEARHRVSLGSERKCTMYTIYAKIAGALERKKRKREREKGTNDNATRVLIYP